MGRYTNLTRSVDKKCSSLKVLYEKHISCHPGCSSCCQHHLSVFGVEAEALRGAVSALPHDLLQVVSAQAVSVLGRESAGEGAACPLLVDDRCAVYEARPIICRTHGLPLEYEAEDGVSEVDWCPLNFTSPDAAEVLCEDGLLDVGEINHELAAADIDHSQASGRSPSQSRVKVAELILGVSSRR